MHLADREVRDDVMSVLVSRPGDGCLEVWRKALPEDATVVGIDRDGRVADHVDGILVGDVSSRRWLLGVLAGRWFDVIHDRGRDEVAAACLWPYLRPGGILILEGLDHGAIVDEVGEFLSEAGVFPAEEVVRMSAYHGALVVEKRNPRVIPFLDAFTGKRDPLGVEREWTDSGAMKVDQTGT